MAFSSIRKPIYVVTVVSVVNVMIGFCVIGGGGGEKTAAAMAAINGWVFKAKHAAKAAKAAKLHR